MTLSRRGFLLGSAAAVVAASPVVRAIAAQPVIYSGEVGTYGGFRFLDETLSDAVKTMTRDRILPFMLDGEAFYVMPVHPTMARDLAA